MKIFEELNLKVDSLIEENTHLKGEVLSLRSTNDALLKRSEDMLLSIDETLSSITIKSLDSKDEDDFELDIDISDIMDEINGK
ncbi:MAG: hypothetical protein ISR68_00525 [Campylobacterales bacterium]|nr:hypothetical protein [Campylobacterales bacterium]